MGLKNLDRRDGVKIAIAVAVAIAVWAVLRDDGPEETQPNSPAITDIADDTARDVEVVGTPVDDGRDSEDFAEAPPVELSIEVDDDGNIADGKMSLFHACTDYIEQRFGGELVETTFDFNLISINNPRPGVGLPVYVINDAPDMATNYLNEEAVKKGYRFGVKSLFGKREVDVDLTDPAGAEDSLRDLCESALKPLSVSLDEVFDESFCDGGIQDECDAYEEKIRKVDKSSVAYFEMAKDLEALLDEKGLDYLKIKLGLYSISFGERSADLLITPSWEGGEELIYSAGSINEFTSAEEALEYLIEKFKK